MITGMDGVVAAVRRLEASPELVQQLAEAGRRHIVANFNVEKNTARLLELTKALVDDRAQ